MHVHVRDAASNLGSGEVAEAGRREHLEPFLPLQQRQHSRIEERCLAGAGCGVEDDDAVGDDEGNGAFAPRRLDRRARSASCRSNGTGPTKGLRPCVTQSPPIRSCHRRPSSAANAPAFPEETRKSRASKVLLQVVTRRLVVGLQLHGDPEFAHRLLRRHEPSEDDAKVPVAEAVTDRRSTSNSRAPSRSGEEARGVVRSRPGRRRSRSRSERVTAGCRCGRGGGRPLAPSRLARTPSVAATGGSLTAGVDVQRQKSTRGFRYAFLSASAM